MKAAVIERPGLDNLKVEELPTPESGPGEVLVRLRAAALTYRDTLTVAGGYGSRQKQARLIPLSDGADEVPAVGLGVVRWRLGGGVFPRTEIRTAIEPLGAGRHIGKVCIAI